MRLVNTRSIHFKLVALFVLLVTAVMVLSGWYFYVETQGLLERQRKQAQDNLQRRLQGSLQLPVWNFNHESVVETLKAEITEEVRGIAVLDAANLVTAKYGETSPGPGITQLKFPLTYVRAGKTQSLGTIVASWSDAVLKKTLRDQIRQRAIEILLVDVTLLAMIWLSLHLMVFRRLHQLNAALLNLANSQQPGAHLALTLEQDDEFDEVARGVNLTTRRLLEDLQARHRAETEARETLKQLKEAQSTLIQTEKLAALGSLVAGIAHELNTPIGNALVVASTLQDRVTEITKQRSHGASLPEADLEQFFNVSRTGAELVMRNLTNAADLINNFKQVAVDRTSANRRRFELTQVVEEVLATLHHMIKSRPVTVVTKIEQDLQMDSYPGSIGQVISNLFINALLHGIGDRASGSILIRAARVEKDAVAIEFSDDGNGIAEDHLDKVFNPFFTTRLGQGGSGLGLNIVYNTVTELLGGSISVTNGPQGGASFHMVLPLNAPGIRPEG
jgi:signal transduction histidine kinase